MALSVLCLILLAGAQLSTSQRASTFAGSTQTAHFPPPGITATIPDPNFPDGTHVGHAGSAPTGGEAAAIATAPAFPLQQDVFPLVRPVASDARSAEEFDILSRMGNGSPWRSVPSKNFGLDGASPLIPSGCELVQLHVLHRHGARYPQDGPLTPSAFAAKVHAAATSKNGFSATGPLAFLNTWSYLLGEDNLTPFGRLQMFNLGVGMRVRYGFLLNGFKNLPVFRTTSNARMVDSALNFAAGFFGLPDYEKQYHQLIEVQAGGTNSTLAPFEQCPNTNSEEGVIKLLSLATEWSNIYLASAQKRLSTHVRGLDLAISDLLVMQQLCGYELVELGSSRFCDLFTKEEWEGFAYANSLFIWYGSGPGNPTTAASGIGWVQELVSRLTQTRITDFSTSVNKAVVSSNITFPLDQPIYVDATHDSTLSAVYVAMNFTNFIRSGPLPADHIPKSLSYNPSEFTAFGSNLVGQVLSCPASGRATHIRWIINDGVVPLTGIKGCRANQDGLCDFDDFVSGMKQRIKEVDYQFACFGNYTFPDGIVDGQPPKPQPVPPPKPHQSTGKPSKPTKSPPRPTKHY